MAPALLLIPAALASFILAFGTGVEFVRFTSLRPLLGGAPEPGGPGEPAGPRTSSGTGGGAGRGGGRDLETSDGGSPGEGAAALEAGGASGRTRALN